MQIKTKVVKTLSCGDVIGQMSFAEFTMRDVSPTSVSAKTDGSIAVLVKSEIKNEIKKFPEAYFRLMQVIAKCAMETFLFNLNGTEFNPFVRFPNVNCQDPNLKALNDFKKNNKQLKAFLAG